MESIENKDNVKILTVKKTVRNKYRTTRVWQYDKGHVLEFEGFDLPQAFEVHFSNEYEGTATTHIGENNQIAIPDVYLETAPVIYAWIYLRESEDVALTKFEIEIPVKARAEISDEEPTPEEESVVAEAIVALNHAVEQTAASEEEATRQATAAEESAQAAQTAKEAAEQSADDAAESARTADQKAKDAAQSAEDLSQAVSTATGAADTATQKARVATEKAGEAAGSADAAEQSAQEAARQATAVQNLGVDATMLEPGSDVTVQKSVDPETGAVTLTFGFPEQDISTAAEIQALIDDYAPGVSA